MPSGDVQRSSGGLPACPSSTAEYLSSYEHDWKKIARIKKKESATHGNDFVLNLLFIFLSYRKLNVTVQALY